MIFNLKKIFVFILFISFMAKSQRCNLFTIKKIDSTKNTYLIYAQKEDSIIKIVSTKQNFKNNTPIKVNEKYALKIKSLLFGISNKRHIGGIKYNGEIIKLDIENKSIWDLFTSENLKGLYYIKK